jgi:hypothetical protein
MRFLFAVLSLCFVCVAAQADVWKWVDANGKTHFVDTNKPIFTWTEESGEIYYSDTPDHEDAISVELVWVAEGTLDDLKNTANESESDDARPGETPEERAEREEAAAYYCKRATQIYESYVNAPRLYKTNESGERVYLNKEEAAKTIAETRAQKDDLCT